MKVALALEGFRDRSFLGTIDNVNPLVNPFMPVAARAT